MALQFEAQASMSRKFELQTSTTPESVSTSMTLHREVQGEDVVLVGGGSCMISVGGCQGTQGQREPKRSRQIPEMSTTCGVLHIVTDLAPPALHRFHSVISDFRPPSVTESGEAALRRLLGSRAVGGYSLTSDDPALG